MATVPKQVEWPQFLFAAVSTHLRCFRLLGLWAYCVNDWFLFQWPSRTSSNIATKKLIPTLFAAAVWGPA